MNKKSVKFASFILASMMALSNTVKASGKAPKFCNVITETDIKETNVKTEEDLTNLKWLNDFLLMIDELSKELQKLEEMDNADGKDVQNYCCGRIQTLRPSCSKTFSISIGEGRLKYLILFTYPRDIKSKIVEPLNKAVLCIGNYQYSEAEAYIIEVLGNILNLYQYLQLASEFYSPIAYDYDVFKHIANLIPELPYTSLRFMDDRQMIQTREQILRLRGYKDFNFVKCNEPSKKEKAKVKKWFKSEGSFEYDYKYNKDKFSLPYFHSIGPKDIADLLQLNYDLLKAALRAIKFCGPREYKLIFKNNQFHYEADGYESLSRKRQFLLCKESFPDTEYTAQDRQNILNARNLLKTTQDFYDVHRRTNLPLGDIRIVFNYLQRIPLSPTILVNEFYPPEDHPPTAERIRYIYSILSS